ncbi:hypothetical protein Trydic_g15032 [Trypoxylus dichotomus]
MAKNAVASTTTCSYAPMYAPTKLQERLSLYEIRRGNVIELSALGKTSRSSGPLAALNPFADNTGVLRVGGRIEFTSFDSNKRHSIILPKNHILTEFTIKYEHIRLFRSGTKTVPYSLRERYWLISGTTTIKKVFRNCITCFKVIPRQTDYIMGKLPSDRLLSGNVFHIVGIDNAGPFLTKEKKHRKEEFVKTYVCLFICFSTKAGHLELVSELTTDAFLAALRWLIARQGTKQKLDEFSTVLKSMNLNGAVSHFLLNEKRIAWYLNPSHSPHFGGLWEADIKATIARLKRVIGNAQPCFEDSYNVPLKNVDAMHNFRERYTIWRRAFSKAAICPVGRSYYCAHDAVAASVSERAAKCSGNPRVVITTVFTNVRAGAIYHG